MALRGPTLAVECGPPHRKGGIAINAAVATAAHAPWELKDVPVSAPGPNQVLIKNHASGLCYTDVHQTNGDLPGLFPRVLGHEPVGEIVAVGAGVPARRLCARV